jgi:hypothetical protein
LRSRCADVQAERRLAETIAAMHEALAALADEVTGGPARAFLVPDAAAFLAAADEWAATLAAADCTMQLAGPLPPYHFVRLELGGA